MPWIDDKRKDADMMFAVRAKYTYTPGNEPNYSGKYGPYASLKNAEKKAKELMAQHYKYKGSSWYDRMYTDLEVIIEGTKIEWIQVGRIEVKFE